MTSDYSPETWAEDLLTDVNLDAPTEAPVPIDANTVGDILHWMPAEEPSSDWYNRDNPLNASLGTSASDGTGSYPNLETGANETAKMIDQSNMAGIRAALVNDDAVGAGFSAAVVASPWASSHYGGDPEHIAKTVASPTSPLAPAGAGSPGSTPINLPASGLGSATLASSSPNATEVLNLNPFDLFGIPQAAGSAIWSAVGPFLAKAMLVMLGGGVILIGLYKTTDSSGKIGQLAQSAAEVAPAAAA